MIYKYAWLLLSNKQSRLIIHIPSLRKTYLVQNVNIYIMADQYEQNRELTGLPEERLLGIEEIIVPFHVVTYCLRDGSGMTA